jgi:hypothetical protein
MARQITLMDWVTSLAGTEDGITLEFRVFEIDDGTAVVQPVIAAGATDVWRGDAETLDPFTSISLSGFRVDAEGNLVLRNFGVII